MTVDHRAAFAVDTTTWVRELSVLDPEARKLLDTAGVPAKIVARIVQLAWQPT